MSFRPSRGAYVVALSAATALTALGVGSMTQGATVAGRATPPTVASTAKFSIGRPVPLVHGIPGHIVRSSTPPAPGACDCYEPAQFEAAYGLASLYKAGDNGKGETIVIIDCFGSPTIQNDLKVFDAGFKLPAPPSFKIIAPVGKITTTNDDWATETTLDVEYAHAIAPGASIVLVETPVAETEGAVGFPQIVKAENYVLSHKLGDVISQSFGATEQTFGSDPAKEIAPYRTAFIAAQKDDVTVLAASGDDGATDCSNPSCSSVYDKRVNSWPSSDPLVTSVGGLKLSIGSTSPYKVGTPVVWNETALGGGAGGGGESVAFGIPAFQSGVKTVVGSSRGTPDVAMSASADTGGAELYSSFDGPGWGPVGGTSEASPEFAGIVAIADQVAKKSLGFLDTAIYAMGAAKDAGLVDVTSGNNSYGSVTGYTAGPGYDMASGWGTVNAADFVPELVAEAAKVG